MKRTVFAILAVFAILLTACTSPLTDILPGATQASNELTNTQLAVGTLKLEGTEQDISAEQARELLVLWYVYSDLSQSDIAAQEEVDGLLTQVQENMTTEQMQAITDMDISQQDISSAAQGSAKTTASSSNTASADGGEMSPPDGGMTGGMDMPADMGGTGSTVSASQQTAPSADNSTEVPSAVVDALIEFLEKKIA